MFPTFWVIEKSNIYSPTRLALGFLQLGRQIVSCGLGHRFPRIRGPVPPAQPYSYRASYIPWYLDTLMLEHLPDPSTKGSTKEGRPKAAPPLWMGLAGVQASSIKHLFCHQSTHHRSWSTFDYLDRSRLFFGARLFHILEFSDFRLWEHTFGKFWFWHIEEK